jgi:hypothetical protein
MRSHDRLHESYAHGGTNVNGHVSDVTIDLRDLEVVADAVMLRLDDPGAEAQRVARMRELLWSASELTRALSLHTQHALVDCCGTHGNGNLAMDTVALHSALTRYAELIHHIAIEYRVVVQSEAA